jgi:hypothetical protein
MGETIQRVEYFYALVSDKPGEGRRLLEHISEMGINLTAFTAFPAGEGQAQLDFFPENPGQLQKAAAEAGIRLVGPKKAFLIQGRDRIGALHEHHLNLSNAGINAYAANGVVDGGGRFGYVLWVKPEDYEKAAEILEAD